LLTGHGQYFALHVPILQSDVAVDTGRDVRELDDRDTRLQNAHDVDGLREDVLEETGDHFEGALSKPPITARPQLAEEKQAVLAFGQRAVILPILQRTL